MTREGAATVLTGKKILITGATGQVARPVAEALAKDNEVWCLGRFSDATAGHELRSHGIRAWRWDMGTESLDGLPDDFTYVMHSAFDRGNGSNFEASLDINCGAIGKLMMHCRRADAFLFVSTGAVYAHQGPDHRYTETDALGGQAPWFPTYPVAKLASEGAVRALATALSLPTTIARLSIAYGPYGHGGVPILFLRRILAGQSIEIPRVGQNWCNPIHTDDIARQVPLLWSVATVPARVVNWGGDEVVGITDMMNYLAQLSGTVATYVHSDVTRATHVFDNTLRTSLIGNCTVDWRDGLRRTLEAHLPDLVSTASDA
jgi:nucleoside-diphosphate-sugar epimerase